MAISSDPLEQTLATALGPGLPVSDADAPEVRWVWTVSQVEIALAGQVNDRRLRAVWTRRRGSRGTPLLVICPTGDSAARVLGPQRADEPVREVGADALVGVLRELEGKSRRDATAALAAALERMDRSGIPGLVIRGLLTKHLLARRLPRDHPEDWRRLQADAASVRPGRTWRENLTALGYQAESRADRGYLLRHGDRRIAVVHPFADPSAFARMTPEGSPPEGLLVADCRKEGVPWGVLATNDRFRLFPAQTSVGAATARYLEIDITHTEPGDWAYLGLLAPESLAPGGLLERLVEEAAALGNELRETIERQIREEVLPALARGMGAHLSAAPRRERLTSPNVRRNIEDAALLILFRLLFFLYLKSRGYLPYALAAYRPHSATQLLQEARGQGSEFDARASTLWDRFTTLVHAMRTGNTAWGLPAYNGDLFASDVLPGAELIEEARIADSAFGPALAALGFDPEGEDAGAGVDYGDLEITHLGRIYEGLLSLHLSYATEPLAYDGRVERWVPAGRREPEIAEGQLFYQTESGGRKAGGVYYTPQVIVRHLVDHAVLPALEEHLGRVAKAAERNANDAARLLFDFRILDPAMGSAHFLADALDRVAERIGTFLADHPLKPVIRLLEDLKTEARWEGRIEDGDLLRRLVLKHCVYGVDLSPMAVEVAKVSLWLASFVPGLSLAYLGHNLKRGDALVGVADPVVLADLGPLFGEYENAPIPSALRRAREVAARIAETPDRTPDEVEASRRVEDELREVTQGLDHAFSVWCAEPFGLRGARNWLQGAADHLLEGREARGEAEFLEPAIQMAEERSFFHWPVEFPEVFMREGAQFPDELGDNPKLDVGEHQAGLHEAPAASRPGFDVVIGNPPWEELTVEELGFYALHDPGLRGVTAESERRRRIDDLRGRYPQLEPELERRRSDLEGKRRFFGPQGGYVAQGAGDTDTYKLFCERYRSLAREGGRLGVVLPRSAFLVDGARGFRRWLFPNARVARLDFILNNRSWAFPIHPQYTIALLAARRRAPTPGAELHISGPSASRAEFERASGAPGVAVALERLQEWTRMEGGPGYEVPLLPSPEGVAVFDRMRRGPRFDQAYPGVWSAFPVRELDETNDRRFFRHSDGVPVWKGRNFDQYDPHGREPAGFARERDAMKRLQAKRTSSRSRFRGSFPREVLEDPLTHPFHAARVAFRDVSRATDSRTVRACLVPPRTFLTNTAPYLVFPEGAPPEQAFVLGVLDSLPFDWQARRFVETHLNFYVLDLLCFPPADETNVEGIARRAARLSCVDDRFAEFAAACSVECGPLAPHERDRLRAEIDALVAQAYGLAEDDLEVIFADFTQNAVPDAYRALVRGAFTQ
ncbi:MAG: hypothetical protein M3Q23_00920 [Actinomycetota bacterium]|nr:hypothetical protein [Actinomycetota bacterium]